MINGLNSSASYPLQSGGAGIRERTDVARSPAASPEKNSPEVQEDLARPGSNVAPADIGSLSGELLQRRVEARQAAEDVRLERFNADDLPLSTARALSTFVEVAAQRDGQDVELAGIDIRI